MRRNIAALVGEVMGVGVELDVSPTGNNVNPGTGS